LGKVHDWRSMSEGEEWMKGLNNKGGRC
jgi:hypothetical protein